MDSVQKQVESLMSLNPDTELQFDDGILPANSNVLCFFSSVLRGAIEAHSAGGSDSSTIVIPMNGLSKGQWLEVAPFWHPVEPAAVVETWAEAKLLLRVGSRFELRPALDKASEFLTANVDKLTVTSSTGSTNSSSSSEMSLWKWLQLADELRLSSCLPALVNRVVSVDRDGCSILANTQGLSAATLQQLVATLVTGSPVPSSQKRCSRCTQFGYCSSCARYYG
jgi:hypothetical protein